MRVHKPTSPSAPEAETRVTSARLAWRARRAPRCPPWGRCRRRVRGSGRTFTLARERGARAKMPWAATGLTVHTRAAEFTMASEKTFRRFLASPSTV
eukprot:83594-Prorocentrum_minimum.AAC.4